MRELNKFLLEIDCKDPTKDKKKQENKIRLRMVKEIIWKLLTLKNTNFEEKKSRSS